MSEDFELDNLLTVKSFAQKSGVSVNYIHYLHSKEVIEFVKIDGVLFVDKERFQDISLKMKKGKTERTIKRILKTL